LAAAALFGASAPVAKRLLAEVAPSLLAALLYAGAGLMALPFAARAWKGREAPLRAGDLPLLAGVVAFGGVAGPLLLLYGLARTSATLASLLLNLEAVFTVALARLVYREPVGARVAAAVAAIVAGGAALVIGAVGGEWRITGVLAIAGATLAWAIDNALARPLAERDPLAVVAAKGTLGAALSLAAALIAGEHAPPLRPVLVLLACGATGYGLSLRLYLLAQRRIGAGRTGSVFALAPFVGAALAIAFGDRALDAWTLVAAGLFGLGVYLHVTEHHHHAHVHAPANHDHVHRHDDGHHTHVHDPPFVGEHAHPHHHDRVEHDHDHAPDLHHDHH